MVSGRTSASTRKRVEDPVAAARAKGTPATIRPNEIVAFVPLRRPQSPKAPGKLFKGPLGTAFVFRPTRTMTWRHDVFQRRKGKYLRLDIGPGVVWPFNHAFTEDGRWLFLAYESAVRRVDLTSNKSELIVEDLGGNVGPVQLAVAGELLAIGSARGFGFLPVDAKGGAQPDWTPCTSKRCASSVLDRRVLVLGTREETWLFGVSGTRRELLAHLTPKLHAIDFSVEAAWDDAGRVYCDIDRRANEWKSYTDRTIAYSSLPWTFEIKGLAEAWDAAFAPRSRRP